MGRMRKSGKKRRGSTFVEAALVFPVCILAVVTVVYIMLFLYTEAATQAMVHVAANAGAGAKTDTVISSGHLPRGVAAYESSRSGLSCIRAEKGISVRTGGIGARMMRREIASTSYTVDEAKLIRYTDIVSGVLL